MAEALIDPDTLAGRSSTTRSRKAIFSSVSHIARIDILSKPPSLRGASSSAAATIVVNSGGGQRSLGRYPGGQTSLGGYQPGSQGGRYDPRASRWGPTVY